MMSMSARKPAKTIDEVFAEFLEDLEARLAKKRVSPNDSEEREA